MIVKTDSFSGKSERCDGIKEACCQSSQSAIAKGRLRLDLFDYGKLLSVFLKNLTHLVINAEIDQIVAEELTN